MRMRWTHEGVSLRAPVRFARRLRAASAVLFATAGLGTLTLLAMAQPPPPAVAYDQCVVDGSAPQCGDLRPSWKTWDYTRESWRAARMCTLYEAGRGPPWRSLTNPHHLAVEFVQPGAGVVFDGNLDFLRMVAAQGGACEVPQLAGPALPYNRVYRELGSYGELAIAAVAHADREYDALVELEQAVLAHRAQRAQAAEVGRYAAATWRAVVLRSSAWAWVPALLVGWIALLVGIRRLTRAARPLELEVSTEGVRIDGRWIPRANIAFLSLEGQRLRIERWTGAPVHSRPLPPEALVHADEISAAIGVLGVGEPSAGNAVPPTLHAVLRASAR